MPVRKRKKKNKLRGNRTHGKGDTKNKRGKGVKGGTGKAGSHKHKYTKYYAEFGKRGKKLKPKKKEIVAINLEQLKEKLDFYVEKGLVKKEENYYVIDGVVLGIDKLLGKGTLNVPLLVKNIKVTEKAKEKIIASNGKVVEIEKQPEEKGEQ